MASEEEVATTLARAKVHLEAGEAGPAVRSLRLVAEDAPIGEIAAVVQQASRLMGFEDLEVATTAVLAEESAQSLYEWGYVCFERGVAFLAVPALRRALSLIPNEAILIELMTALAEDTRYKAAAAVADEYPDLQSDWLVSYLFVHNLIMSGQLSRAHEEVVILGHPENAEYGAMYGRLTNTLARADLVMSASAGALDDKDLRGWHFVLNTSVLLSRSPYGFHDGMTGRWAFTQDSFGRCNDGLERLRHVLAATGQNPRSVALLTDRSSQILGSAAATLLGLPAQPYDPGKENTLVVAYDLAGADPEVLSHLRTATAGQILYEHACCWTEPGMVSADVLNYLHQTNVAPWDARMVYGSEPNGPNTSAAPVQASADERPVEVLAAEIVAASDDYDDEELVAGDAVDDLTKFARTVEPLWARSAGRDKLWSPGPVPSSRFF